MSKLKNVYKIFNNKDQEIGSVSAISAGDAKIKAVERKIVSGKKQIKKVILVPYDDPYEQSWSDIYG